MASAAHLPVPSTTVSPPGYSQFLPRLIPCTSFVTFNFVVKGDRPLLTAILRQTPYAPLTPPALPWSLYRTHVMAFLNITQLSPTALLIGSRQNGLHVGSDGRVIDCLLRPSPHARPPASSSKEKTVYQDDEIMVLRTWMAAWEGSGIPATTAYEALETVMGTRSWLSWRSKSNEIKGKQLEEIKLDFDCPYPNLRTDPETAPPETSQQSAVAKNNPSSRSHIPALSEPPSTTSPPSAAAEPSVGSTIPPAHDSAELDVGGLVDNSSYAVGRADKIENLLNALELDGEPALRDWLRQPFVVDAYSELFSGMLQAEESSLLATIAQGNRPSYNEGRSGIAAIKAKALAALNRDDSIFLNQTVDKACWMKDDHSVRFMIQIVLGARSAGVWNNTQRSDSFETLCEKASRLLRWLMVIHRPSVGESPDSRKTRAMKQEWREFFNATLRPLADDASPPDPAFLTTLEPAGNEPLPTRLEGGRNLGPTDGRTSSPRRDNRPFYPAKRPTTDTAATEPTKRPKLRQPVSTSRGPYPDDEEDEDVFYDAPGEMTRPTPAVVPLNGATPSFVLSDKLNQHKGAAWMLETAWKTFNNELDHRLAGWGVGRDHRISCVLVPEIWKQKDPSDMLATSTSIRLDAEVHELNRMKYHFGDMNTAFARAVAWFSGWPRGPRDLEVLVGALTEDDLQNPMHGSHTCHQAFCILPLHICYEPGGDNLHRWICAKLARSLRKLSEKYPHLTMPECCVLHDPPCLYQNAALTPDEAVQIQFGVLREAKGLPPVQVVLPVPPTHEFANFEFGLPLRFPTMPHSDASSYHNHLVNPPEVARIPGSGPRIYNCPFCCNWRQSWSQITSFWLHLRDFDKHTLASVSKMDRVATVKASGAEYLEWQAERGYDYSRRPTRIDSMVKQTQSDNFSWEILESWTLYKRVKRTAAGDRNKKEEGLGGEDEQLEETP